LVLQSSAQGTGGEIFVLDMATPVKIIDLARQMIELSGLRPDVDIEIAIIGLRPGEKLFEELSHKGENIASTHHPKILRFMSEPLPFGQVEAAIQDFTECLNRGKPAEIKASLKQIIPEYSPCESDGLPAFFQNGAVPYQPSVNGSEKQGPVSKSWLGRVHRFFRRSTRVSTGE